MTLLDYGINTKVELQDNLKPHVLNALKIERRKETLAYQLI